MFSEYISENELVVALENGAVESMRIEEVDTSGVSVKESVSSDSKVYRLVVKLNWKDRESLLITQRKKPKEWASLDRLVRHIDSRFPNKLPIDLLLKGMERKNEIMRFEMDGVKAEITRHKSHLHVRLPNLSVMLPIDSIDFDAVEDGDKHTMKCFSGDIEFMIHVPSSEVDNIKCL